MQSIKVEEEVIEVIGQNGECIVQYCPGHSIPRQLKKGETVALIGKATGRKIFANIYEKKIMESAVSLRFRKEVGLT